EDGQVAPISQEEGAAPTKPRHKLSAMRILAQFDRNALELKKVEMAMETRGIVEGLDEEIHDGLPPMTPDIANQAMIMIHELSEQKKAAQALEPEPLPSWRQPPPPDPEDQDGRWPITKPIREAILVSALDLCGLRATPEGNVEPTGEAPAKP